MIPTAKWRWFEAWIARQAERRIAATFGEVWVEGLERLAAASTGGSAVVVANHSAWWDGMVVLYVSRRLLRRDVYCLMGAEGLLEHPFFLRGGAFGFDREDPGDGAAVVRYAATLLRGREGRVLWIFPQGQERPPGEALSFERGAAVVARLSRAPVVPVGIRYLFLGEERPRLLISIGEAIAYTRGRAVEEARAQQERAVQDALARIDGACEHPARAGFSRVHRRGPGALDRLATRLLGAITRPRGLPRSRPPAAEETRALPPAEGRAASDSVG